MRIVLIGFIVVLIVVCGGLVIRYSRDAGYVRDELDRERYKRMVSEENLQNANTQISSLEAELKRSQKKVESIETVLERTKAINVDLKARLDKAAEIQVSLDKKIAELQQMTSQL